eukprot:354935-Chlamydomonas_euryale.AAC.4
MDVQLWKTGEQQWRPSGTFATIVSAAAAAGGGSVGHACSGSPGCLEAHGGAMVGMGGGKARRSHCQAMLRLLPSQSIPPASASHGTKGCSSDGAPTVPAAVDATGAMLH